MSLMVIFKCFMSGIYISKVNKLQHQQNFSLFVFGFNDNNFL
jgi:hypothetical protein